MGVQEESKSKAEAEELVTCLEHPRDIPKDGSSAYLQVPDWECFFSLLIETGAVEEEQHSPGETVEKLEDAGEQGKPHSLCATDWVQNPPNGSPFLCSCNSFREHRSDQYYQFQ